jgi:hypothetical protein
MTAFLRTSSIISTMIGGASMPLTTAAPVKRFYGIKGREIKANADQNREGEYSIKGDGTLRLARKTNRPFIALPIA